MYIKESEKGLRNFPSSPPPPFQTTKLTVFCFKWKTSAIPPKIMQRIYGIPEWPAIDLFMFPVFSE